MQKAVFKWVVHSSELQKRPKRCQAPREGEGKDTREIKKKMPMVATMTMVFTPGSAQTVGSQW